MLFWGIDFYLEFLDIKFYLELGNQFPKLLRAISFPEILGGNRNSQDLAGDGFPRLARERISLGKPRV